MSEPTNAAPDVAAPVGLARGFAVLAAFTFCLIVVGALVRAHDAGLACPDWPLCKGEVVPAFDLKVAFEWGHRVFAGAVSIGLVVLSVLGLRAPGLRRLLRPRLALASALLLTQIIFGALTVWLLLAPWTVSAHLVLGNTFCLTLLWISRDLFEIGRAPAEPATGPQAAWLPLVVLGVTAGVALQMVLGGLVSSHYAGLACSYFPTCDGESIAPRFTGTIGLHVMHRLNGFLVLGGFGLLTWMTRSGPGDNRLGLFAFLGLRLVLLQIFVGVMNVLMRLPFAVTALHSAVAAAIVLATALLVREVVRARGVKTAPQAPSTGARVAEAR